MSEAGRFKNETIGPRFSSAVAVNLAYRNRYDYPSKTRTVPEGLKVSRSLDEKMAEFSGRTGPRERTNSRVTK